MSTQHYKRISLFMMKAGQSMPDVPTTPDSETRELRAKLIFEECMETVEALGFTVLTKTGEPVDRDEVSFAEDFDPNIVEVADGCADISVVTMGTLIACGIDDEPLLKLVDDNNLAKFGKGHSFREDGKLIKPKDHRPPDIAAELDRQNRESLK